MNTHFPGSSENHTIKYTQDSGVVLESISVDIASENNVLYIGW